MTKNGGSTAAALGGAGSLVLQSCLPLGALLPSSRYPRGRSVGVLHVIKENSMCPIEKKNIVLLYGRGDVSICYHTNEKIGIM